MLNKILIASVLLVGCGGSLFEPSFNSSFGPETDGGSDAAGGAATVDSDSGVGAGGKVEHAHGGEGSGGRGAGGAQGSGGASTGGELSATGGTGSGGVTSTGGSGSGGAPEKDGGCALVTHDNGLGQTWQDCVPLGTYDQAQAMKACAVSGEKSCLVVSVCGSSLPEVRGYNADNSLGGRWGYEGVLAGYVGTGTLGELCLGANDPNNHKWD